MISNFKSVLDGNHYKWRHGSILKHLEIFLSTLTDHTNTTPSHSRVIPPIQQNFVRAGEKPIKPNKKDHRWSLLDRAKDWKLLVDYVKFPIVFPPEIFATPQRPDIVIWSAAIRLVILIELTCPAEEGINEPGTGWTCTMFAIEVGMASSLSPYLAV